MDNLQIGNPLPGQPDILDGLSIGFHWLGAYLYLEGPSLEMQY